ncbi:MAG: trypsin-like peptidase domain-containing protein [Planctomycetota bacterium]|jgi:S1-C subfamily serine protease
MTQYRCAKCRTLLESDDGQVGQTDTCPLCGQENVVPVGRQGKPGLVIGIIAAGVVVVLLAVVLAVSLPSDGGAGAGPASNPLAKALDDGSDGPSPDAASPKAGSAEQGSPSAGADSAPINPSSPSDGGKAGPLKSSGAAEAATQSGKGLAVSDPAVAAEIARLRKEMEDLRRERTADDAGDLEGELLSRPDLLDRVRPAVLLMLAYDAEGDLHHRGSGFFVSADGLAITNYHVLDDAHSMAAKTKNGAHFNVSGAIAVDVEHDLALVKVEAEEMPYLKLRTKPLPRVGTSIMVVGSPRGAEDTCTPGMISTYRKGEGGWKWIQTEADIAHGSSGGPMVMMDGHVVGVIFRFFAGDTEGLGLNMAVPVEYVHKILEKRGDPPAELASFHGMREGGQVVAKQVMLAYYLLRLDETDRALEILRPIVEGPGKKNPLAWHAYGIALRHTGDSDRAAAAQKQAIALGDVAEAYVELAILSVYGGRYEEAPQYAVAGSQKGCRSIVEWAWLSLACRYTASNITAEAKKANRELSGQQQATVELLNKTGDAANRQATEGEPSGLPDEAYWLSYVLVNMGKAKEARELLVQYIGGNPKYAPNYRMLASIVSGQFNSPKAAVEVMQSMLASAERTTASDWRDLGDYAERAEMYGVAAAAYRKWIDILQQRRVKILAGTWHTLGVAYINSGNYVDAVAAFRRALDANENTADLGYRHMYLGIALRLWGGYSESIDEFNRAKAMDYNLQEYHFHVGLTYQLWGKADKARRHYRLCISQDSTTDRAKLAQKYLWKLK